MNKRSSCCAICENSNRASICAGCVNYRLNEVSNLLKSLNSHRDSLYSRLSEVLVAKGKADDQLNWRLQHREKVAGLKEKLRRSREQLKQGKAMVERMSLELKVKYSVLDSARGVLEKNRLEQLDKFYPNLICTQSLGHMAITTELLHKQSVVVKQICKLLPQRKQSDRVLAWLFFDFESTVFSLPYSDYIMYSNVGLVKIEGERTSGQFDQICNARLPRGLDPHSIPSEELGASLGYMVQLLNLVVRNLAAPALHNSGFAGSSSRIWQRDSYWNARPSSRSNEYPLFIPRQNHCSSSGENSATDSDRSSSNFGVASIESENKACLDPSRSSSFSYSSASPHSVESHEDLQKGIALLKKSVACVTAYCYNLLCLEVPSETSTFEAFARLLSTLSSSTEVRSVFSLQMASSRSGKEAQKLNKSVWNVNSAFSSSALLESRHALHLTKNMNEYNLVNSTPSFLFLSPNDMSEKEKHEGLIDGWDLVEHPKFPPPPSRAEDVEHWTRAMFVDATSTKKR